jgi:hypothetical protein
MWTVTEAIKVALQTKEYYEGSPATLLVAAEVAAGSVNIACC